MLIEAEEYVVKHNYASMTDAAFVKFVSTLVVPLYSGALITDVGLHNKIREVAEHGRTVMIEGKEVHRAFMVFTEQPMKFLVQFPGTGRLFTEEVVLFWHDDAEPKGQWETKWEYMAKALAWVHYNDDNYRFEEGAKDRWTEEIVWH